MVFLAVRVLLIRKTRPEAAEVAAVAMTASAGDQAAGAVRTPLVALMLPAVPLLALALLVALEPLTLRAVVAAQAKLAETGLAVATVVKAATELN